MPKTDRHAVVQGTLDMLILGTLKLGPAHGHGIATLIEQGSGDRLRIDHGSLYPALQRLQQDGYIVGEWGTSDNNRRAKYYRLTAQGRRHLHAEASRWAELVAMMGRIIHPPAAAE